MWNQPILLAPLPQSRSRWKLFVISFGTQLVLVLLLCQIGLLTPARLVLPKHYEVTSLIAPPVEDFATPPPVTVKAPRVPAPSIAQPALELPAAMVIRVAPTRRERPVPAPEIRPEVFASMTPPVQAAPPKPAAVVHTGGFGGDNPAPAGARRPPQEVQTGGFGDPNGSRAEGVSRPHLPQMRVGSFEMPAGPGYGNGTGGTRGVAGAVAAAGFGGGTAPSATRAKTTGTVQPGGFGDARPVVAERQAPSAAPAIPVWTPVEIISKPQPSYTEEARRLKIEGEVLLEARFRANGELQVLGVRRGLGHGLDEAAIRAAAQIRFRPARQDGVPVDSIAALHVLFQLAY